VKRAVRAVTLAIVLVAASLSTAGCASLGSLGKVFMDIVTPNKANDFSEVRKQLQKEVKPYTEHRLIVVDESGNPRAGVLTAAQYEVYLALETNAGNAATPVNLDMLEWSNTNTRPVSLTPHMKTLKTAQDALIAYVKKEAAKP